MDHVDVLIITALSEEFVAAKTAGLATTGPGAEGVRQWHERDADGPTPYLFGEYVTSNGRRLRMALARPTRMGGRGIGPIATTLTDLLKPTCLAMCGVCAGNPDDTAPGDVVVAEAAYEYDEGRWVGSTFQGDHRQYPLDVRWIRMAQEFNPTDLHSYGAATDEEATLWFLERLYRDQQPRTHPARGRYFPRGTWQPRLEQMESDGHIARHESGWTLTNAGKALIVRRLDDDVDGPARLPFAVVPGPMASGSAVIKDAGIWKRLKTLGVRKIAALEMEAATIATIAHERRVPHWLVAKGVMDGADPDKNDRYKTFAAHASAEVLFRLLARLVPSADRSHSSVSAPSQPSTAGPGPRPGADAGPATVPGRIKLEVCRRLSYDWQDLADLVGVPYFAIARFRSGHEPRELWEWLESRNRLPELPEALDQIGRPDLADLIRSASS